MSWEKVKLGDISANIQTGPFGSQLHQHDYSEVGTPVVMPKDLIGGKISEQSIARVSQDHVQRLNRHIIQKGDILYSRRGDVGRCAIASDHETGWLCGTGCLRVTTDTTIADSKFVFYQLQQPEVVGWVEKHAVGATMLNLNTTILSNIPLLLPPIETQRRIADILSAYDDLIENNRKQIKLLEEAAQRLYKEWFVDLRFPGHEHTKIVDGVPEGWRNIRLSDIAAINANNVPKDYPYDHIEYTDLSSVQNGIIKETTRYFLTEAPGRAKRMANDGDVIWGMVRPNLKSFALVLNPKETDVFSTGFCILSPKTVPFSYLYYAVTTENFVAYLVNCTNGAAYPAVKPIHFAEASLLCPDNGLLDRFNAIVEPMLRKREKLLIMINQAQQACDRLLPKLMSGEIEV